MQNKADILYRVIDAISTLSLGELLQRIDAIVAEVTHADSTGIYTLDQDSNSVVLRASIQQVAAVGNLRMMIGEGITGWVAAHGQPVILESSAALDPRFAARPNLPDDTYEAFLSVPILSDRVIVGVLNVKHKSPHKYPKPQVDLLQMIGKLVGRAVEHAELLARTNDLESALATQKSVSRAKLILIEQKGLSENDAYHLLRRKAMESRKTMLEVADAVITSAEILS